MVLPSFLPSHSLTHSLTHSLRRPVQFWYSHRVQARLVGRLDRKSGLDIWLDIGCSAEEVSSTFIEWRDVTAAHKFLFLDCAVRARESVKLYLAR